MSVMPIWMVGEELVGILDDPERAPRAGVSLPGTQFEVGTAGRDQCDFRHGEDAVEQDQQDDDDDFHIECMRYVPYVGRCPDARAGSCACAGASAVRCGSVSFCKDTKSRAQKQTYVRFCRDGVSKAQPKVRKSQRRSKRQLDSAGTEYLRRRPEMSISDGGKCCGENCTESVAGD